MALYDRALPQVYGYLADRCRDPATAEDLTSETFLAAVRAAKAPGAEPPSLAWLVGVARHKLVDHWRRQSRQERLVDRVAGAAASGPAGDDPWDAQVDRLRIEDVLSRLGPHHRAALTLRYRKHRRDRRDRRRGRRRRRRHRGQRCLTAATRSRRWPARWPPSPPAPRSPRLCGADSWRSST